MSGRDWYLGVTMHARDRMEQYFGEDLTQEEWLDVVAAILDGRAIIVRNQNNGAGYVFAHPVRGITRFLAWNPAVALVTTTLPSGRANTRHIEGRPPRWVRPKVRRETKRVRL